MRRGIKNLSGIYDYIFQNAHHYESDDPLVNAKNRIRAIQAVISSLSGFQTPLSTKEMSELEAYWKDHEDSKEGLSKLKLPVMPSEQELIAKIAKNYQASLEFIKISVQKLKNDLEHHFNENKGKMSSQQKLDYKAVIAGLELTLTRNQQLVEIQNINKVTHSSPDYPYVKKIHELKGSILPSRQSLDSLKGAESGHCFGLASAYWDQIKLFGKCIKLPVIDNSVFDKQAEEEQGVGLSRQKKLLSMHVLPNLNSCQTSIFSIFKLIKNDQTYLLSLLSKTGGHCLTIRPIRDTSWIEIYDPNLGVMIFSRMNAIKFLGWLLKVCYRNKYTRITLTAGFSENEQPKFASASTPLPKEEVLKEKRSTFEEAKKILETILKEVPLEWFARPKGSDFFKEFLKNSDQFINFIEESSTHSDDKFDDKNFNLNELVIKRYAYLQNAVNLLSKNHELKSAPMPVSQPVIEWKNLKQAVIEKIDAEIQKNSKDEKTLQSLKTRIQTATVNKTLSTIVYEWLGETNKDTDYLSCLSESNFIVELLNNYEISPYRLFALQELILRKIIILVFGAEAIPFTKNSTPTFILKLRMLIHDSLNRGDSFHQILANIKMQASEHRPYSFLSDVAHLRSSHLAYFYSLLSQLNISNPESLLLTYKNMEKFDQDTSLPAQQSIAAKSTRSLTGF